jgi:hypothetical protein
MMMMMMMMIAILSAYSACGESCKGISGTLMQKKRGFRP